MEQNLRTKSKEEIIELIRKTKSGEKFDMSGYDGANKGSCTLSNTNLLNRFASLGIYDFTHYLFLDFYKGVVTLYMQYFYEEEYLEFDLSGLGTSEIIYEVLQKTVLSNKSQRRRS